MQLLTTTKNQKQGGGGGEGVKEHISDCSEYKTFTALCASYYTAHDCRNYFLINLNWLVSY